MLAQAVRHGVPENVAYVRADAAALPFHDGSFDAVACLAALYLIERPLQALDELVRVLAPGGRLRADQRRPRPRPGRRGRRARAPVDRRPHVRPRRGHRRAASAA
jgi:arsenite methyltransferase